jgi:hypothetical protein
MSEAGGGPMGPRRFARLAKLVLLGVAAFLAVSLGPEVWRALVPKRAERLAAVGFLHGLILLHGAGLILGGLGCVVFGVRWVRGRRSGRPRPWSARLLALCVTGLIGLGMLEGAAALLRAGSQGRGSSPAPGAATGSVALDLSRLPDRDERDIVLVVIGESSARGVPFDPWVSVGQILAWQLQRIFPDRRVVLDQRASNGATLRPMVERLGELPRRPDAVLVYSGHNEFQARYGWSRTVDYYPEDRVERPRPYYEQVGEWTPLLGLIREALRKQEVGLAPAPHQRSLVDRPTCSEAEYRSLRQSYHDHLETLASALEEVGTLPILVVPAGNEAGYGPNRSVLLPGSPRAYRELFESWLRDAISLEATDPAAAERAYLRLLADQPAFAECHFRLARLLEATGRWDEANAHYAEARDRDGLPLRCPGDFQSAYREVASRHDVLVVDGPKVLRGLDPHGKLGDLQFQDIQHPSYLAYLALAQDALDQLAARRAFGWPEGVPAPRIDPEECARHLGLDSARWAEICDLSGRYAQFFGGARFDPREAEAKSERFRQAARRIESGVPPEEAGVPGLGVHPPGVVDRP